MEENDPTINDKFELRVFSRRWNRDAVFTIQRTVVGWFVPAPFDPNDGGFCDRTCSPHLYRLLRHAGIQYPSNLGEWFAWLWKQARDKGLSHADVQRRVDEIAKRISRTDQSALDEIDKDFWEAVA